MIITDTAVETATKQSIYTTHSCFLRDDSLIGFGVRVYASGKASYIIEPVVQGRTKRKVIGKFPSLTVNEARELATVKMAELTSGIPATVSNEVITAGNTEPRYATLDNCFNDYINNIALKKNTIDSYKDCYKNYLSTVKNTPIDLITQEMVIGLYLANCKRSVSQSNKSMKILQAVMRYSGLLNNPVQILATKRLTRQLKPRTSYIPLQDLSLFYKGLAQLKHEHTRLYLELLLHTGLRASEGMQITASSVATGVLIITETKNHSDHNIPLTQWLRGNLMPFLETNPDGFKSSDIRKSLITACQYLGYRITRHDLRRTFASYASEAGCDYLLIKRALNHSVSDITARYIQTSPSTLAPVFDAVAGLIADHRN